jgi:hypothetical protein
VLALHDTEKISLFTAISSLPESTDNCKWYVEYSYGIMNHVCKCNFFLQLVIDGDRRNIQSK